MWTDGSVYEGELAINERSGLGVHWDQAGKVIQCGRWVNDKFVEQRPVPRSKVAVGAFLSASGQQREAA